MRMAALPLLSRGVSGGFQDGSGRVRAEHGDGDRNCSYGVSAPLSPSDY